MDVPRSNIQYSTIMKELQETRFKLPEGFENERLVILPRQVTGRLRAHPIAGGLYPTRIGFFPKASGHYRTREQPIDEHLLILCVNGSGICAVHGQTLPIGPGQVVLLPAGQAHHYEASVDTPWSIGWIHLRGSLAADYLEAMRLSATEPVMRISNLDQARKEFEVLYGLTQGTYSDTTLLALHTGMASFLTMLAYGRREIIPKKRDRVERVRRVIGFLHENLHRPVTLAQMAAVAHWTPNHFNTVFREMVNETPASFFLHLKLSRASDILKSTDHTIEAISAVVGFQDAFYFSRCFKRHFGITPSQYRQDNA